MSALIKYFKSMHLPKPLQRVSLLCHGLALEMDAELPESAEKLAGLRKLLEAKDCFVRAKLDAEVDAADPCAAAKRRKEEG